MRNAILTIAFLTLGCLRALAQDPYELLWEVRAPGQAQPSYVFGTMHISDSRVYNMPDSVLLALQSCHYVALEADLDSACYSFFHYFFGEGEHTISELENMELKMTPKLSKPDLNEFLKDPDKLKRAIDRIGKIEPKDEIDEDANELQFLDAFIFRLARDNGKQVVGLERMADQIDILFGEGSGLSSKMASEGRLTLRELKAIYLRGDIREIGRMLDGGELFGAETKEIVIDRRNRVMVNGADSLMGLHPTFVAVGAAHLPGKKGILKLLEEQGYHVRPVDASQNTGLMLKAKDAVNQPDWVHWRNEGSGYALDVPTPPYRLEFTDIEFPMYAGIDFSSGWMYYFMGVPLDGEMDETDRTEFAERFFNNYQKNGSPEPEKVTVNGLPGLRGVATEEGKSLRVQVLMAEKLGLVMIVGVQEEAIFSPAVDHLFNSVEATPVVPLAKRAWRTHADARMGFSMVVPDDFSLRYKAHEDFPKLKDYGGWVYSVEDKLNEQEFSFSTYVLPPTLMYDTARILFNELIASMDMEHYAVVEESDWEIDGYKGLNTVLRSSSDAILYLRMVVQANRMFIFALGAKENDPELPGLRAKLDAFRLLPLHPSPLTVTDTAPGFTVRFPAPAILAETLPDDSWIMLPYDSVQCLEARDPATSSSYSVYQASFGPFTRIDSPGVFHEMVRPKPPVRRIIRESSVTMQGIEAKEYVVAGTDGKTEVHIRHFFHGNRFYGLSCEAVPEDAGGVDAFFKGFVLDPQVPPFDWTSSKLAGILAAVQSPDSALSLQGMMALAIYDLSPADHALAVQFLEENRTPGELPDHHFDLVDAMLASPEAGTREDFRRLYQGYSAHPDMQAWILSAMLLEDTLQLRETALELLAQKPPRGANQYYRRDVGYSLSDALISAVDPMALFDSMAFLLKDPEMQAEFLYAAQGLAFMGELEARHLGLFRMQFQELADDWITHLRRDEESPETLSMDYEFLLYALSQADPDTYSYQLIRAMMDLGDLHLEEFGMITLLDADLDSDLQIEKARKKRLLDTPGYRFKLTEWMLKHGQTKGFPKKHFSQETLGRVDLEEYFMVVHGEMPVQMDLAEVRQVFYKGEYQDLHVYKVGLEGSKSWITAFAGPFISRQKPDALYFDLTGSAFDEWSSNERQISKQVRKWVADYEEEMGDWED